MKLDGEAGTSTVDDHPYVAPEGRPWERCSVCGLAEAAHARTATPYRPTAPRAVTPGPFGTVPRPR